MQNASGQREGSGVKHALADRGPDGRPAQWRSPLNQWRVHDIADDPGCDHLVP